MPTGKPRITFMLTPEQLERLETYRFEHRMKNQSQAVLSLIEKGLASIQEEIQKTPLYSSEALRLAKQYDGLDGYGQRLLELVAAQEAERCAEQEGPPARLYAAARDGGRQSGAAEPGLKLPERDTPLQPPK